MARSAEKPRPSSQAAVKASASRFARLRFDGGRQRAAAFWLLIAQSGALTQSFRCTEQACAAVELTDPGGDDGHRFDDLDEHALGGLGSAERERFLIKGKCLAPIAAITRQIAKIAQRNQGSQVVVLRSGAAQHIADLGRGQIVISGGPGNDPQVERHESPHELSEPPVEDLIGDQAAFVQERRASLAVVLQNGRRAETEQGQRGIVGFAALPTGVQPFGELCLRGRNIALQKLDHAEQHQDLRAGRALHPTGTLIASARSYQKRAS